MFLSVNENSLISGWASSIHPPSFSSRTDGCFISILMECFIVALWHFMRPSKRAQVQATMILSDISVCQKSLLFHSQVLKLMSYLDYTERFIYHFQKDVFLFSVEHRWWGFSSHHSGPLISCFFQSFWYLLSERWISCGSKSRICCTNPSVWSNSWYFVCLSLTVVGVWIESITPY